MDVLSSPFLFGHVYDIDTVITALCGSQPQWLNTATGALQPHADETAPCFALVPLPESTGAWLLAHPDIIRLTPAERACLEGWLVHTPVSGYPALFRQGRAGGWLYLRLKEVALAWLDTHGLVPPSLRHVNREALPVQATAHACKVTIQS